MNLEQNTLTKSLHANQEWSVGNQMRKLTKIRRNPIENFNIRLNSKLNIQFVAIFNMECVILWQVRQNPTNIQQLPSTQLCAYYATKSYIHCS